MIKFSRILARGICIWIVCVIATGILFEKYIGLVCAAGAILLLGSFLLYSIYCVFKMVIKQPVSGYSEAIPPSDQIHVTAKMTGRTNRVVYVPKGRSRVEYTEYEMEYVVQGTTYTKWFHMYPGPDLGDAFGSGYEIQIVCNRKKPTHFEVMKIGDLKS